MRPSLDALAQQCADQGIIVSWARLPAGRRGLYVLSTRTIYLRHDMPDRLAVPTLMHEMCHAERGDDGPQPAAVEARINRAVACRLVTVAEYAAAEALAGPGVGALAVELDVPVWVVETFRRTLRTRVVTAVSQV